MNSPRGASVYLLSNTFPGKHTYLHSFYTFDSDRIHPPSFDDAYITWVVDDRRVWSLSSAGMAADLATEIGARPVPQEPMVISHHIYIQLERF